MRSTISWLLLPALLSCGGPAGEPEPAPPLSDAASPAPERPAPGKPRIRIQPTTTRFVDITHTRWKKRWAIQLPEAIASRDRLFLADKPMHPQWRREGESSWSYVWRAPDDARSAAAGYSSGLELRAMIDAIPDGIRLSLTLTNESADTFHGLNSEGGCFQARNGQFVEANEVDRTHVLLDGEMTSLGELDCAPEVRCHYTTEFKASRLELGDGYWRTSSARIDSPAIIGAVSKSGKRFVAMGYEGSWSALQNTDAHHCIHSNPYFGDLEPGESVTRIGYILFGDDMNEVVRNLADLLDDRNVQLNALDGPA